MDILIIIALLIAGIILLLAEVFLVPGLSLAGIGAAGCFIYANFYAFSTLGLWSGVITLLISVIASVSIFVWFMRSKTLDKLALNKEIDSSVKQPEADLIHIGDKGIALTRLAQIGNADINGHIVEVKSAGDFIEEKCPIMVSRISNGVIIVIPAAN